MKIVIALGGNMISDAGNKSESFEDQKERVHATAEMIADIIELGHTVVVTHGNGPQVGSLLLQQQANVDGSVSLPLNILGALTQGQIGVILQHALLNVFARRSISKPVIIIPTTVIVDENDPGFTNPTKPVGPFIDKEVHEQRSNNPDFYFTETPKGYRRIVASPYPKSILEIDQINQLTSESVVIAGGGGGNPTVLGSSGYILQDAVIDKDRASALMANLIDADLLMILTNVEGVYRDFGLPTQQLLSQISSDEARKLVKEEVVAKGSMLPKVEAGIEFKGKTIITSPDLALDALNGSAGTQILP